MWQLRVSRQNGQNEKDTKNILWPATEFLASFDTLPQEYVVRATIDLKIVFVVEEAPQNFCDQKYNDHLWPLFLPQFLMDFRTLCQTF